MTPGGSFSRIFDKLKHPVAKGKRKSERRESSIAREKVDSASTVTQPQPHVVAKDRHDREGEGAGVEGSQENQHPDAETETSSAPGREESNANAKKIDQVHLPTPTSSVSHNGEPDGM